MVLPPSYFKVWVVVSSFFQIPTILLYRTIRQESVFVDFWLHLFFTYLKRCEHDRINTTLPSLQKHLKTVFGLFILLLESIPPANIGQEPDYSLNRSPLHHRATKDKQPCTNSLTHTSGQFKSIDLINWPNSHNFWEWEETEDLERTHACTGWTSTLHAQRPQVEIWIQDLLAAREQLFWLYNTVCSQ